MRRLIPYSLLLVLTVLAGLTTAWSYHQSKEVQQVGMAIGCKPGYIETAKSLSLTCSDDNIILHSMVWTKWGQNTAYGTGTVPFDTCNPTCAKGKWKNIQITIWGWNIQNGLYTQIASDDPQLFNPLNFHLSSYPQAG